ncbi:class I SAM-dependent methyltransferase [Candidatus Uhrbacteria bacterium]|nr:class I SAM-dependent methyltransferase [Candidatus Uhrbacteria bacterium]
MLAEFLQKNGVLRKIVHKAGNARARELVGRIRPFLGRNDSILDIGSGTCNVCEILSGLGHRVTPLDVRDLSFSDSIKPVIYDGNRIPFGDNEFDKSLLLTVLHHTPDPERVLLEAKRVSREIVMIEDIYVSRLHRRLTFLFDSLLNLEFTGHPHSNRNDGQWRETFGRLGLELVNARYRRSFLVFTHATYHLRK